MNGENISTGSVILTEPDDPVTRNILKAHPSAFRAFADQITSTVELLKEHHIEYELFGQHGSASGMSLRLVANTEQFEQSFVIEFNIKNNRLTFNMPVTDNDKRRTVRSPDELLNWARKRLGIPSP